MEAHMHTDSGISMLVVDVDALAQKKRFSNRKETRCRPLLNARFEPRGFLEPNLQQTGCPLTNWLSYRISSLNLSLTALHYIYIYIYKRYTCLLLLIPMLWHRQAVFEVVFFCWMQGANPECLWNRIPSRLNARWQTDWAIEDQAKTWTRH